MSKQGRKRKSGKRQHGGTLLGLILGLIIGLSIAVGVALTIKNTPVPFSSKMARPGKPVDSALPDQVADPNAPMYGNRDAAKDAAREMERKAEEERVAALLQGQTPGPLPGQVQGQAPGQGADPRLALAQPHTPTSMDDRYLHYLQVGAFLQRSDAESTRARITLIGLSANISEHKSTNGTLYRVRIGPFGQFEAMSRVRGRLIDNGVDVAIVREPK